MENSLHLVQCQLQGRVNNLYKCDMVPSWLSHDNGQDPTYTKTKKEHCLLSKYKCCSFTHTEYIYIKITLCEDCIYYFIKS